MPPKRDGGKTNDSSTDSDNSDTFRKWTGRPLDEPMWYYVNKKLLFDEVEGARDFITKGIVISEKHGTVYVNNVNHAQAYISSTITEGTLEAPFQLASLPALVAVPANDYRANGTRSTISTAGTSCSSRPAGGFGPC